MEDTTHRLFQLHSYWDGTCVPFLLCTRIWVFVAALACLILVTNELLQASMALLEEAGGGVVSC